MSLAAIAWASLTLRNRELQRSHPVEEAIAEPVHPLDEAGARELTERIKRATRLVCLLLLEAHERRAWVPLGHGTWERYVRTEFSLSRSRSYELLDQARVIRVLRKAAGMSGIPDISAYAAGQIRPYLALVAETVRERIVERPEEDQAAVVAEVVRDVRARIARELRADAEAGGGGAGAGDVTPSGEERHDATDEALLQLLEAVDALADLPSVDEVLAALRAGGSERLAEVEAALEWLEELARLWRDAGEAGGAGQAGGAGGG